MTPTFVGSSLCADWLAHLLRRLSVLAPECLGNTCFAPRWEETAEGRDGGGRTVFAHVDTLGLSLS